MYKKLCFFLMLPFALVACGGGSTDSTPTQTETTTPPAQVEPVTYTGMFIDSPVQGLKYATESQAGITNASGEFIYQLNETITFSIGGINFIETSVADVITPLNIFNTQDINQTNVVNMLRLLQTLDVDGIASNGITLNENIHTLAAQVSVDFSSDDFESQVAQLVLENNAVNISLISAEQAILHFEESLRVDEQSMCGNDHPRVGFTGSFSTLAHNVTGNAEIIDNCTISITNFNYDASAPAVYFYANNSDNTAKDSFTIGNKLRDDLDEYADATIILKLPNGKTLDDVKFFSVWCVDFAVSFGDLTFTSP